MEWFKLIFQDLCMILLVEHFIVVIQWVTLQLSEDLTGLVGKIMKNKVNSYRILDQKGKRCDQAYCIQ